MSISRLSIIESVHSDLCSLVDRHVLNGDPACQRLIATFKSRYVPEGKRSPHLRENAVMTFLEGEASNKRMNKILASPDYLMLLEHHRKIRRIVRSLLGPLSKSVLDRIVKLGYFGPGVNVGTKAEQITKVKHVMCTRELLPFIHSLCKDNRFLSRVLVHCAEGPVSCYNIGPVCVVDAKLTFVPKNGETDRSISVEPSFNSFFQNGVGEYLRKRLLHKGINLYDQTINQDLAKYGSLSEANNLATLDVRNASNTLSIETVRSLLPRRWFHLLNILRSHRYSMPDGSVHQYEMFSGMGNGFTFALESIIFYALTASVSTFTSVYGDDIICSSSAAIEVSRVLRTYGFEVNYDKSFISGPFRESCGSYWHNGRCVKPVRPRKLQDQMDIVNLHNQLYAFFRRHGLIYLPESQTLLRKLRKLVPNVDTVPLSCDYGFHNTASKGGYKRVLAPVSLKRPYSGYQGYVVCLYNSLQDPQWACGKYALRMTNLTYKVKRVYIPW